MLEYALSIDNQLAIPLASLAPNFWECLEQVDHHDVGHQQVQQEAPEPESRPKLRAVQLLEPRSGPADSPKVFLRDRDEKVGKVELVRVSPEPEPNAELVFYSADDDDDHSSKICFEENFFPSNEIGKEIFQARNPSDRKQLISEQGPKFSRSDYPVLPQHDLQSDKLSIKIVLRCWIVCILNFVFLLLL